MALSPLPDAVVDQVRNYILGKHGIPRPTEARADLQTAPELRDIPFKRTRFTGKTELNRKNGSRHRNTENKRKRAEWQQSLNSGNWTNQPFPWKTCNGKKNRQVPPGRLARKERVRGKIKNEKNS